MRRPNIERMRRYNDSDRDDRIMVFTYGNRGWLRRPTRCPDTAYIYDPEPRPLTVNEWNRVFGGDG